MVFAHTMSLKNHFSQKIKLRLAHSIPNDFGKHLAANNIISDEWGTPKPGFQVLEVPWRNRFKVKN